MTLAGELAKDTGIKAALGAQGSSTSSFSQGQLSRLGEQISESAKSNQSLTATLANAATDTLTQQASMGSRTAQGVQHSDSFQKSTADLQQKQEQFTEATSRSASLSSSQSIGSQAAATQLVANGGADRVIAQAMEHAGYEAMRDAKAMVARSAWAVSSQKGRDVQAALIALEGRSLSDQSKLLPGHEGARQAALVSALGAAGGAFGGEVRGAALGDASRNAGVAAGVAPGAATAAVSAHTVGSGLSEGAVMAGGPGMTGDAAANEVLARSGARSALAGRTAQEEELGAYRTHGGTGLSDGVSNAFDRQNQRIGDTTGSIRQSAAEAHAADDTGGLARSMKTKWNSLVNYDNNNSTANVEAALGVARDVGNGLSGEQLEGSWLSTLRGNDTWNLGAAMGQGITDDSALAAAHGGSIGAKVTSDFEAERARMAHSSGVQLSPELTTAMAAVSATRMNGGASPEVAGQYFDAKAKLSPGELKMLEEWSDKAHNSDNGSGIGDIAPATIEGGVNPHGLQFPSAR
jgi:hypothetical protein